MGKRYRIGVVADIHEHPEYLAPILSKMKAAGIDALIGNGDLGQGAEMITDTVRQLGETGKQLNIPVRWHEGSHESILDHLRVRGALGEAYEQMKHSMEAPLISFGDEFQVLTIPGSDILSGSGQFKLDNRLATGLYETTQGEPQRIAPEQLQLMLQNGYGQYLMQVYNINDVDQVLAGSNIPSRNTLAVCHVPAAFEDLEHGVDRAYYSTFNTAQGRSLRPADAVEALVVELWGDLGSLDYRAYETGHSLEHGNVGNKALRRSLKKNRVPSAVNSHIHESGWNAHTADGTRANERTAYKTLFHNTGSVDQGKAAIYTAEVTDRGVTFSYENIQV